MRRPPMPPVETRRSRTARATVLAVRKTKTLETLRIRHRMGQMRALRTRGLHGYLPRRTRPNLMPRPQQRPKRPPTLRKSQWLALPIHESALDRPTRIKTCARNACEAAMWLRRAIRRQETSDAPQSPSRARRQTQARRISSDRHLPRRTSALCGAKMLAHSTRTSGIICSGASLHELQKR